MLAYVRLVNETRKVFFYQQRILNVDKFEFLLIQEKNQAVAIIQKCIKSVSVPTIFVRKTDFKVFATHYPII